MPELGGKGPGKGRAADPLSLAGSRLTTGQIFFIVFGSTKMWGGGFPDDSFPGMLRSTAFGSSPSD